MKKIHKREGGGQPDFISLIQKYICTRNTVKFLNKVFIKAVRGGGGHRFLKFFYKIPFFSEAQKVLFKAVKIVIKDDDYRLPFFFYKQNSFLSLFFFYECEKHIFPINFLMSLVLPSGLPTGFIPSDEILNAERPNLPPPPTIYYVEKHVRPFI